MEAVARLIEDGGDLLPLPGSEARGVLPPCTRACGHAGHVHATCCLPELRPSSS